MPARPGRARVGEQDRPGRRSVGWPGHAVLQVPVIELEDWIVARTRHYDAGFISDDPGFHHAHITVLAPLTSWDVEAIAALAASSKPFDFELDHVDTFADGTIYLHTDKTGEFKQLTAGAWLAHPQVRPYGGDDPLPHLTLDRLSAQVGVASTEALLDGLLPVHGRADALELVWYRSNECHLIGRWPLGG